MRMRNRLLAGFGALGAAGVMVLAAPHAHADVSYSEQAYADNGAAYQICKDYDRLGVTVNSTAYIGQQIVTHTNFGYRDAGDIVIYSVQNYCPRHWPDLSGLIVLAQQSNQGASA